MPKLENILKKSGIRLLFMLCLTLCLLTGEARAQGGVGPFAPPNGESCNVYQKGSSPLPEACPPGRRNDIDPTCLRQQNNSSNSCINTMPVGGTVGRVPEDVCARSVCNYGQPNCPYAHSGMDYAATTDADVLAAADGVVTEANDCASGYGIKITIKHVKGGTFSQLSVSEINKMDQNNVYQSVYGHLSKRLVNVGTQVRKNQVIGKVGGSNCKNGQFIPDTYGNHLHFEIKNANGSELYDPMCSDIQGLCGGAATLETSCRRPGTPSQGTPSSTTSNTAPSTSTSTSTTTTVQDVQPAAERHVSGESTNQEPKKCQYSSYRDNFKLDEDGNTTQTINCVFCSVFLVLFDAASTIADTAFKTFSEAVGYVIIIAFAVWIGIKVMGYVSSMEQKDPKAMIKELLSQAFIVMGIYMLLGLKSQQFQDLFLTPIFLFGLDLATSLLDMPMPTTDGGVTSISDVINSGVIQNTYHVNESGGLNSKVGDSIIRVIYGLQTMLMDVFAMGSYSWCLGFREYNHGLPIFPHLGFVLIGATLWLGSIILLCIYPFLLVDTVLQMAIVVGLLPVTIGCAAFKITRKYVKQTFDSLMNFLFNFVFLTIILVLIVLQLQETVGKNLLDAGANGRPDNILANLAFTGTALLQISFTMLLGWAVLGEGKNFATKFAGGLKLDVGQKVGGMAASAATSVGLKAFSGTIAVGGKALKGVKYNINKRKIDLINKRFDEGKDSALPNGSVLYIPERSAPVSKLASKLGFTLGRDKLYSGTGDTAHLTKFVDGGRTQVDKNLSKSVNETTKTYASGMKRTEYSINTTSFWGDSLAKRDDGSLDMYNINKILKGAGQSQDGQNAAKAAIMQQLIKEQLGGDMAKKMEALYKERKIETLTNKDGTTTFQLTQTDANGNPSIFRMTMGSGGRAMVEASSIDASGRATHVQSDGIMKKTSTYKTKDGKQVGRARHSYALSKYFESRKNEDIAHLLQSNGSLFTVAEQKEGRKQINGKTAVIGEGADDEKDRRPEEQSGKPTKKYTINRSHGSQSVGGVTVFAVTEHDFSIDLEDGLTFSTSPQIDFLTSPIKKGDKIGTVKITFSNGVVESVDLVADRDA